MERKIVHVIGTGTIGEPLIGLLCNFKKDLGIDEITFNKYTPLTTDRSKVANLLKRGARLSTNADKIDGFNDIGIKVEFTSEEAIDRASVVIDCTPTGFGHQNKKDFYQVNQLNSTDRIIRAMQGAVDIVNDSPHPVNKVSACLFFEDDAICSTNLWPASIDEKLGRETRIGNSSGTVHAETACIFKSDQATDGASMAITDPFCPNCAKNIVEAGIKYAYIDHKGFEKEFWGRRAGHFKNMSMEIMARGGVSVYEVNRKNKDNLNYIYTGLQIIKPEVFYELDSKIFSINKIWNKLIKNNELQGIESNINFLHVSTLNIYKSLLEKKFKR